MTPEEEIAAGTRLEMEAGRNRARQFASNPALQEQYMADFVPAREAAHLPIDPDVKLPADVRATIARGNAKFQESQRQYKKQQRTTHTDPKATAPSSIISSVVDQKIQDRRDAAISALKDNQRKRADSRQWWFACESCASSSIGS